MQTSPIRRWVLLPALLTLAAAATPAGAGAVVHVDDDAPAGGDGSSWSAAYRHLQDALATAGAAAEIRVAQGIYRPDRSTAGPGGTGDRAATFRLLSGRSILGGFAGIGSPDPDARDVEVYPTVLSGDLNGDDGPPGSFLNNADNSLNVVTVNGTNALTVLDGCTVTGGNADGPPNEPFNQARGAGIWNADGALTISNCRIEYNFAAKEGGGMMNRPGAAPTVIACTFRGNVSQSIAGGMLNYACDATVTDCLFIENTALSTGGMHNYNNTVVVTGCVFTDNSSAGFAGAASFTASTATITNCTFTGNVATGGGIYVNSATPAVVSGSTFCDNEPTHIAGNWSDAGGNSFCPVCDDSSGPVLEVPAAYPTIQAAIDAACDGAQVVVSPGTYYERINFAAKSITLRSTDGPDVTTIDAQGTGRAVLMINAVEDGMALEGFTIVNGSAVAGGGARIVGANTSLVDCHFRDNAGDLGGAVHFSSRVGGRLTLRRCVFDGNQAEVSCGAVFAGDGLTAIDCDFTDNDGGQGPGAVASAGTWATYVNCMFAGNTASFIGGGLAGSNVSIVNCIFTRNAALLGGGLFASRYYGGAVVNCTFSLNQGGGVAESPPLSNCVLWGNAPEQIGEPEVDVTDSDVQGGWPGVGNIDADPLFVQAGTDDVRLSFGSPCTDAGSNAALPPDTVDLDGDGDTTEPIPFDAGGQPRVQGGVVDMGAWEGEFEPGPPAGSASNLDQGGSVVLVPGGAPFNPLEAPAAIVTNISGADNASVAVVQIDLDLYPGAGGFSELGSIFTLVTTLADGEYFAMIFIPLNAATLDGVDPERITLTRFDAALNNWAFAASGNTQNSPGFGGPFGNRIAATQGGAWGSTPDLGDYGVFWDPQLEQGFVWANVDHAAEFGVGFALCPSDCLQTPDGVVGIRDLLLLLSRWGTEAGGGPCDADDDGSIGLPDFAALLNAWGPCPAPSAVSPNPAPRRPGIAARLPDLDADGSVGAAELAMVRAAWGPCRDCPADIDGDGRVGVRDMLSVLADWTALDRSHLQP